METKPIDLLDQHITLCEKALDLMERKNHDYRGGTDDPFANFRGSSLFGVKPGIGILLRMQDKMMRVRTWIERGMLAVQDEGLDDAIVDLINYAVLLRAMSKEQSKDQPC